MSETTQQMPSWSQLNQRLSVLMLEQGEWCGVPLPLEGYRVVMDPSHPRYDQYQRMHEAINGEQPAAPDGMRLVNVWVSRRAQKEVWIVEDQATRKRELHTFDVCPWLTRLEYALRTFGASAAWPMDAECRAMDSLAEKIKPHLFRMYILTGMFIETSPRSGVTYVFRRGRPTLAVRANEKGSHFLAALCLHPIAYYADTHAGAMVPTDEVLAHLMLMRGDERLYWRRANQHPIDAPAAAL